VDSVLSHRSNTVLWGLLRHEPGPVDVLLRRRRGTTPDPDIRLRVTRSLPGAETTTRLKIPCTTVERTLVDIAGGPPAELERAVEQAFVLRLIGRTRMADALERAGGRAGIGRLRRLLGGLLEDLPLTRSELERRFLRLVDRAGLPPPHVNRHRAAHRVDFHWPAGRLVVETDGRSVHDNPTGLRA
jgi:hypothetical protein